jgi:cysteine synthase A
MGMIDAHGFFVALRVRTMDVEAVGMARFLVERDGLFVGSSSACNLVAAVRYVKKMGWKDGQTVVTILWVPTSHHRPRGWMAYC